MPYTLTIGGVPCSVRIDGGVVEAQPPDGPRASVAYQCDWGRRYDLVKGLVGSVQPGAFSRVIPHAYPPSPNLYCLSIPRITGVGPKRSDDGFLSYRKAVVEAEYGIPTWQYQQSDPAGGGDPSGQPWTTTTINVSAEVLKPPKGGYYFAGTSPVEPVEDGTLGLIYPQVEITMRRHWCPYVPLAQMMSCVGKVNSAAIVIANYTFPAETLLFAAGPSTQQRDSLGNLTQEVEYKFLGRTESWNKLPRRNGTWTELTTSSTGTGGNKPFLTANFTTALP